jgi:anti-anti-sigma factor
MALVTDPAAQIASRQVGTTREVRVEGEIDLVSAPALAEAIRSALRAEPETLVVDLAEVAFIDSTGLHVLIEARHRATAAHVGLVVIRPSGPAARIFAASGVGALFPDVGTPAAAQPRFVNDWNR